MSGPGLQARTLPAPRLYLVTDRTATGGRPLAEVVAAALRGADESAPGAVAVQLRENDLPGRALLDLGHRLRDVTAAAGVRLFVNDRIDVALACQADGVHLGSGSLSWADVRSIAPSLAIAVSAHSVEEISAAARSNGEISFAVLGPVYDTPSKRAFGAPIGLSTITAAATEAVPVCAIGGVNLHNVKACKDAGAHGVACIRAVMSASDPAHATRSFLRIFR